MSYRNLQYMRQLADEFTLEQIMQQPVAQIPWGHIVNILSKCETKESRLWYIQKTYENSWSRSLLKQHLKKDNVPLIFSRYVLEDKLNEYIKK